MPPAKSAGGSARGSSTRVADDVEAGLVEDSPAESETDEGEVTFRDLEEGDLPALRELQSGLFPVQYKDSFYTKLFTNGYYALVGVAPPHTRATGDTPRPRRSAGPNRADAVEYEYEGPGGAPLGAHGEAVVAVACARVTADWRVAYIMTLGVHETYRRRGLGTHALQLCLEMLRDRTRCMIAQLHVKSLNASAVAFYQRLGWVADEAEGRGGLCSNHYLIDGVLYDAKALKLDLARMRRATAAGGRRESFYSSVFDWSDRVCAVL